MPLNLYVGHESFQLSDSISLRHLGISGSAEQDFYSTEAWHRDQVKLVGAHLFQPDPVRRAFEMAAKTREVRRRNSPEQ